MVTRHDETSEWEEEALKTSQIEDKSNWGSGPWQEEPDRVEFTHDGFPCLINRSPLNGGWCGYVAVPAGHPWYRKDVDDVDVDAEADVHSELTYAAACAGDICHVSAPGEPDDVWWVGFDHAHWNDYGPKLEAFEQQALRLPTPSWRLKFQHYTTLPEAMEETRRLAVQARRASEPPVTLEG